MKLLAIDTATEACSVAALLDGEVVERFEVAGRDHSSRLPLMLKALIAETGLRLSQLDALVCGVGPGSFAGVRIGVSFVKGLALGLDLPVLGVTSLAMLAQGAHRKHGASDVLAAIDARMGEVYFGHYRIEQGLARPQGAERVCHPDAVSASGCNSQSVGAGSGWGVYADALTKAVGIGLQRIEPLALPQASDALTLAAPEFTAGNAYSAATLIPVYLRNRVALTRIEQLAERAAKLSRP